MLHAKDKEFIGDNQIDLTKLLGNEKKAQNYRKIVVYLFLLCFLASFLLWVWRTVSLGFVFELPTIFSRTIHLNFNQGKHLEEELTQIINKSPGNWGIVVRSLRGTDLAHDYNSQLVFPAASLKKLGLATTFCHYVAKGNLDPAKAYRLKEEDKQEGAGTLGQKPAGTTVSYQALLHYALNQSDNTAATILASEIGRLNIDEYLASLAVAPFSYPEDRLSPSALADLLAYIYKSKDNPCIASIIASLTNTSFEDLLAPGIPSGARFAHKVGLADRFVADAGIVFTPDQDFLIVVIANEVDQRTASAILPELARVIYLKVVNR